MAKAKAKVMYKEEWWKPRLSETGKKVRRVICLIYIEDLEKAGKNYYDLLAYLDHIHQPAVVSPIHDRDTFTPDDVLDWCSRHRDPETGDLDTAYVDAAPYVGKPKKPHCHVGLISTAQYNADEWTEIMSGLMHIRPSMWEKMLDYTAFVRYLAHLDSKEKARYSAFDVQSVGGADLSPLSKMGDEERITTLKEIFDFIRARGIDRFHTLVDLAIDSGDIDFISTVISKSQTLNSYFNSKQWQRRDVARAKMDKLNREVAQAQLRASGMRPTETMAALMADVTDES